MIIGTAGHIDHGKTLLVKALTGVETDRLKEEKARGITIELGFAYVPLASGQVLGFVDVPGHERFVHTMLAGAASVDFVVLVVAATDGVMPQTREHVQILDLLGIRDGVVALNKIDLVEPERLVEVETQIRAVLAGTPLAAIDILPVSAVTGAGIDGLKARLADEAESRPEQAARGAFRMAIDRSFTVAGAGTVVTGAVQSGAIAIGDRVVVLPQGLELRVRSLHAQGRAAERGRAGERCALNLAAVEKSALNRGDWLVDAAHTTMSARFDVEFRLLASEARPFKTWGPAHLHIGTGSVQARIILLEHDRLLPGTEMLAQIVADKPLPVRFGDRFVLRDAAAERTIGGGRVIDPRAPQRKRRTPERRALLDALRRDDALDALEHLLALSPGLVDFTAFTIDRGLAAHEAQELIELLAPVAAEVGGTLTLATEATAGALQASVAKILTAYHTAHPELTGMPPEALRLKHEPRLGRPQFAAALALLTADGRVIVQAGVARLPTHASSLGAADQKLWDRILKEIEENRFRPPQVREMSDSLGQSIANIRKLCKTMARMGTLVEVASDRFFLKTSLSELAAVAAEIGAAAPANTFTAAEFKDRVGCGRNVGIQLLEYFDRRGLTARRGDVRSVVKTAVEVFGPGPRAR